MLTKRLILDTTNVAESDTVGSYLISADGTLLTHTTAGAKQALDVNFVNTSLSVTQGTDPWVVSATDLDIRNIAHTQESIRLGDGTSLLTSTTVGADVGLDVNLINASDIEVNVDVPSSGAYGFISVGNTATDLVATDMVGRKSIYIQNRGSKSIFIGTNSSVTAATGIEVNPGGVAEFAGDENVNFHAITASGTANVRVLELGN